MKIFYIASRYGVEQRFKQDSLTDAIEAVEVSLENDMDWPVAIEVDGELVWEQSGPDSTTESIERFKKEAL